MISVPRHDPSVLTGADVRCRRRHMHSFGQRFGGHNEFGDYHQFLPSMQFLNTEQCEPEAAAADILDTAKPGDKGVPDAENFGHNVFFAHLDLHNTPREDRPFATYETIFASVSRSVLTHVEMRGFQRVNGAVS